MDSLLLFTDEFPFGRPGRTNDSPVSGKKQSVFLTEKPVEKRNPRTCFIWGISCWFAETTARRFVLIALLEHTSLVGLCEAEDCEGVEESVKGTFTDSFTLLAVLFFTEIDEFVFWTSKECRLVCVCVELSRHEQRKEQADV
jgi:hypothetical protein